MSRLSSKILFILLTVILLFFTSRVFAAAKTWVGTTNNWNTASNWSPSGVPTNADDVTIPTSPSGGFMPVIASGTLAVNSLTLQASATVTLNAGTLTTSGATTINSNATINISGGTISLNSTDASISGTLNVSSGTVLSTRLITVNSGGSIVQSGGTIHMASSTGTTPTDDIIISAGATFTQSGGTTETEDITIGSGSPAGVYNQSGNSLLKIHRDWKNSGTFSSTGGTVEFSGNCSGAATFAAGTNQFYHITIGGNYDPGFQNVAGSAILIKGNWTSNSTNTDLSSVVTTVTFNGSGNQIIGGTQATTFFNLVMNKSGGILSPSYSFTVKGDWTNNGGSFSGGSYTITFSGASKTIGGTTATSFANVSIASGATYTMNNSNSSTGLTMIAASVASSLSQASGVAFTINGTVNLNQPTASVISAWNINAGSSTVSGLISFPGSNATAARVSKIQITTGTLNAEGGITFTASAAATKVIDMSTGGGTGTINMKGALIVPAASSTLTAGTSGSNFNYCSNGNPQTVNFFSAGLYNNLLINNTSAGATINAAITSSNVSGHLLVQSGTLHNGAYAITLAGGKDFSLSSGATFNLTGTSTMVTVSGGGTKTFGASSNTQYSGGVQVVTAETYGSLSLSGGFAKTMPGSTITVNGNFSVSGSGTTAVMGAAINTTGNFSVGSGASFTTGSYTDDMKGNFTNDGTFTATGSTITLTGSSNQTIGGSATTTFSNLTLNNSTGATLANTETITGTLTLSSGALTTTSTFLLTLNAGSVVSGGSNSAYISGPVKKIGNTSFTFPVGKSSTYGPITISAPAIITDAFTAEYFRYPANYLGLISDPAVFQVSYCEYWDLLRSSGTSNINLTMGWGPLSPCNTAVYINQLSTLAIVHFDGTYWDSHANNGTTGNVSAGTITWNNVGNYGQFTFGTTDLYTNPLTMQLSALRLDEFANHYSLSWSNLTETNMRNYIVERSSDGKRFRAVADIPASGNQGTQQDYRWDDLSSLPGTSYYRVRANGRDGSIRMSMIVRAGNSASGSVMEIYPNPVRGNQAMISIPLLAAGNYSMIICDVTGRKIMEKNIVHRSGNFSQGIELPASIPAGIYHIQFRNESIRVSGRIIID